MNKFLLQFSNDWFFAYTEPVSRTSCTSSFPSAMSSLGKSLSSDGLPSNHLTLRTREPVQFALSNGVDARNRSSASLALDILMSFAAASCSASVDFNRYSSRRSFSPTLYWFIWFSSEPFANLCSEGFHAIQYDRFFRSVPRTQRRKFCQPFASFMRLNSTQWLELCLSKKWASICQSEYSVSNVSIVVLIFL